MARGTCLLLFRSCRCNYSVTLLYYDKRFLDHDTGRHPERPLRLQKIVARLEEAGLTEKCVRPTWQPATGQQLEHVHERTHIENVAAFAEGGGGRLDADTSSAPRRSMSRG